MKSKIRPDIFFVVFLALSIVFHFGLPIRKALFPPYTYVGWVFIAVGPVLIIWSDLLFKKKKTTVKPYEQPTQLLISGPFRISRHPMYLGMVLLLLGVAIVHGTLISFVFPVVFGILMELLFIPFEETNLERVFGKQYLEYKQRVRRWI
jgi:protein-S-isoprenylcysteine O-methyltransferase Ste14